MNKHNHLPCSANHDTTLSVLIAGAAESAANRHESESDLLPNSYTTWSQSCKEFALMIVISGTGQQDAQVSTQFTKMNEPDLVRKSHIAHIAQQHCCFVPRRSQVGLRVSLRALMWECACS